jgi:hypothetical protein
MLANTLFYCWFIFPRNDWQVSDFLITATFQLKIFILRFRTYRNFCARIFFTSNLALGPASLLYIWYKNPFPGDKTAGTWRWPPTSSSAEVKEGGELYIYSPSGPSRPLLGWTYLLPLTTRYLGNVKLHVWLHAFWLYISCSVIVGSSISFMVRCHIRHIFIGTPLFCITIVPLLSAHQL